MARGLIAFALAWTAACAPAAEPPPGPRCAPWVQTAVGVQPQFIPTSPYEPLAVETADFDGDGVNDLIIASFEGAAVLRGQDAGPFGSPVGVGSGPADTVLVADLNNDGRPDAVAHLYGETAVHLLINEGGTLREPPKLPWPVVSPTASGLALADIDGDGVVDILSSDGDLLALYGDGRGRFTAPQSLNLHAEVVSFLVADFNGDGRPEIAVLSSSIFGTTSLAVFAAGGGRGLWNSTVTLQVETAGLGRLFAEDFDGDGKLDLAWFDLETSRLVAWKGPDFTTFLGVTGLPSALAAVPAVLKGAGGTDLVAVSSEGFAPFLNAAGTFTAAPVIHLGGLPVASAGAADVDRDGLSDVLVADPDDQQVVVFFTRRGLGAQTVYSVQAAATGLVAIDLQGNGWPDLMVAHNTQDALSVLLNKGSGAFKVEFVQDIPVPQVLAVGDFNGDGALDVAVGQDNGVTVYLNRGGTFASSPLSILAQQVLALAATDLNRDGTLDLVLLDGAAGVRAFTNDGNATFREAGTAVGVGQAAGFALADLDGDGLADVAVAEASIGVQVLYDSLPNGVPQFVIDEPVMVPPPDPVTGFASGSNSVALGDIDGDGQMDVVSGSAKGQVAIWRQVGPHVFGAPTTPFRTGNPALVAVASVHGPGLPQVLTTDSVLGVLMIWENDGSGYLSNPTWYAIGTPSTTGLLPVDLNGDGRVDLAIADVAANEVRVLLNTCER